MYRILLADDEIWAAYGVKKLIERSGFPFTVEGTAQNGCEAYEKVLALRPDVLITDIRMPGYNGIELLEKMNEAEIQCFVIFISGYAEFEYAKQAVRLGAFDYLLKPIEQEKLNEALSRVRKALDEKRAREEEYRNLRQTADGYEGGDGREAKEQENEQEKETDSGVAARIIERMKQQYTTDLSLGSLAHEFGISTGHLSSLIKKKLGGVSFSEFIADRRVEYARELLKNEALSLYEIAEKTGYNDYFYFIKVFKKVTGISPAKYRRELENNYQSKKYIP